MMHGNTKIKLQFLLWVHQVLLQIEDIKYPNSLFLLNMCGRVKECLESSHIKILTLKTRVI